MSLKIENKCLNCLTVFFSYKRLNRKFCSKKCYGEYQKNKSSILINCLFCNKKFKTYKNKRQQYCSYNCYIKHVGKNRKIKKCKYCGTNLYEKLGFNFVEKTKPNYYYMKDYNKRLHRFNFRKNVLNKKLENFEINLTEWDNMQLNGYDRIWDCGSLSYEIKL